MHGPYISMTSSYAVAEQYALVGARRATSSDPGYVYQIDVPNADLSGTGVVDAALFVAEGLSALNGSLGGISYRHNGDRAFLLSVVDPAGHGHLRYTSPAAPPGLSGGPPVLTSHLQAMVKRFEGC